MIMITILKVIVGSQAHGLATPKSDFDYRGVFIVPTTEILKLGNVKQHTSWTEGKDDDTSWEIGHFLHLATHCNPTILETFLAPRVNVFKNDKPFDDEQLMDNAMSLWGDDLQALFPYIWNSKGVMDAFIGYGLNQRKKFLENKDNRREKYAAAYLRTLYNAYELLSTGTFTIRIADTEIGETVRKFKNGDFTVGEVMQVCYDWQKKVEEAYMLNTVHVPDLEKVNEFLLKVRKEFWQ